METPDVWAYVHEEPDGDVVVTLLRRDPDMPWDPPFTLGERRFRADLDPDRLTTIEAATRWAQRRVDQLELGLFFATITPATETTETTTDRELT